MLGELSVGGVWKDRRVLIWGSEVVREMNGSGRS